VCEIISRENSSDLLSKKSLMMFLVRVFSPLPSIPPNWTLITQRVSVAGHLPAELVDFEVVVPLFLREGRMAVVCLSLPVNCLGFLQKQVVLVAHYVV